VERTVEIAVVVAACWPAIRACASAPYRRANPRATLFAVGMLAAAAALTSAAVLAHPVLLRAIVALSVAAAAWAWWRSRPSFGRDRRLPPGRMTLLPPLAAVRDPRFLQAQCAAYGPVFKIGGLRHPVACVVGLERGLDLLQRFDDDLVVPAMPFSREIPRGFLRHQSRDDHPRYRRVLSRALSRDLVDSFVPAFDTILRDTVNAMAAGGEHGGGVAPLPFLRGGVFSCLSACLLGVGPNDPRFAALVAAYRGLDHHRWMALFASRGRRALAAIAEIVGVPTSRCLLGEIAAAAPEMRDDPTLLGNVAYMVSAAGIDVADLLRWIVKMICDNPEWIGRLHAEARAGSRGLATAVVYETLRLAQSELISRVAARDIAFAEFVIPKGWAVRICVRESHRDASVFPDPERFDPSRFLAARPPITSFMPFGAHRHACLGEQLTVTVASSFLTALVTDHEVTVVRDGPVEMGPLHWRPSERFRIRLAPLVGVPS
jgi:cytochrome P450